MVSFRSRERKETMLRRHLALAVMNLVEQAARSSAETQVRPRRRQLGRFLFLTPHRATCRHTGWRSPAVLRRAGFRCTAPQARIAGQVRDPCVRVLDGGQAPRLGAPLLRRCSQVRVTQLGGWEGARNDEACARTRVGRRCRAQWKRRNRAGGRGGEEVPAYRLCIK